jgi:hypothetical protein
VGGEQRTPKGGSHTRNEPAVFFCLGSVFDHGLAVHVLLQLQGVSITIMINLHSARMWTPYHAIDTLGMCMLILDAALLLAGCVHTHMEVDVCVCVCVCVCVLHNS